MPEPCGCRIEKRGRAPAEDPAEIKDLFIVQCSLCASAGQLREALTEITEHFAGVMGGSIMQGAGVVFANGIEGIPTLKHARQALARAEGRGEG